jgi:hypothetical protein
VRRREFIRLLGGAAAWPAAARAQQPERMRRIGVLMAINADDAEAQARIAAFVQGLQEEALFYDPAPREVTAGMTALCTPIACYGC